MAWTAGGPTASAGWCPTGPTRGMRMTSDEMRRMLAGELYRPIDPTIQAAHAATTAWLARYNAAGAVSAEQRRQLLVERFANVGAGADIRPPFFCDYGFNIALGAGAFLNFNCVILDVV